MRRSGSGAPSPRSSAGGSSSATTTRPCRRPGQSAWVNLLQGEPLVIMLDELPPYFVNAAAKSIGNSDLSVVTTTALSNLLVAVGRDELRNVCVVISDLKATYGAGGAPDRRGARRSGSGDRAQRDEPGAGADEHGRVLPHPAAPPVRAIAGRSRNRSRGARLRESRPGGEADGRDQRLARAVRRRRKGVLPVPSGRSAISTPASGKTRDSSRPAG